MVGEGNRVYTLLGKGVLQKRRSHGRGEWPVEDMVDLTERTLLLPRPGAERDQPPVHVD